jgi:hypothetical protein
MKRNPQDLEKITYLTLEHYNQLRRYLPLSSTCRDARHDDVPAICHEID